ncbi:hypothetical protein [Mycolicibacterium sp. XJ870]
MSRRTVPYPAVRRQTAVQQPSSVHDSWAAGPGQRLRIGLQFWKQVDDIPLALSGRSASPVAGGVIVAPRVDRVNAG